ncbi:alpha/beta-hydrolase [Irpex rosettiformis]|uniref:Alpha/beta-hydrolase n=1 Tax=Irpex rosettiformis TaxID=378272 RepID=A0ACB8U417_9APHY|nr:alpha/beta-hydrolase [Irpex rosettiformis]
MTVSTTSAAVHITPVVVKTFYKHFKTKGRKYTQGDREAEATDDVFFDEAFHIVKAFIKLGTNNTVESLQAFTNTHVPAPYWAAVSPVQIPLFSCNKAADLLIEWFGPKDLKHVVGGEKWWQVRGMDGIDAEWVTEKAYLKENMMVDKKLSTTDANILKMDHLETVMLYVHGGAYFWGSINTHRYQIIRFARKIEGRAFAVNYRKAPQYPWPCPLQDVLAAYMYLINPPDGALHSPVPPSKIVFAGDSAGAGLCLTALTVIRDLGIELPAGAVLISPWVDMTHSFPSVMKNTPTDIIPPHGFIHKPSPIWPPEPAPKGQRSRAIPTQTNPPPEPGHADTLNPSSSRLKEQVNQRLEQAVEQGRPKDEANIVNTADLREENVRDQKGMLRHSLEYQDGPDIGKPLPSSCGEAGSSTRDTHTGIEDVLSTKLWEPKPPKVLMKDPDAQPLELTGQIQLYATNEQLTHPLVSPVLQSSLGNLCPLYIIAGDGEVLRDETIYVAHKAANPSEYPTRLGVMREAHRQKENAEKFTTPTKVHLQVFDGMCHVLTVFTFTEAAKYAYRSIAEFVKHVTSHSAEHLVRNPFPEPHSPHAEIDDPTLPNYSEKHSSRRKSAKEKPLLTIFKVSSDKHKEEGGKGEGKLPLSPLSSTSHQSDVALNRENEEAAKEEEKHADAEAESNVKMSEPASKAPEEAKVSDNSGTAKAGDGDRSDEKSASEYNSKSGQTDILGVFMIRERVDIYGKVRPMEPTGEIKALRIPPQEVGVIKEDPVMRWLTGQELWDEKFKRQACRVVDKRKHYERKYETLVGRARKNGLELLGDTTKPHPLRRTSTISFGMQGEVLVGRRWGPLDIEDEQPPPSAIVGRRDNRESIAMVKKAIYYTAPVTHKTVPKRGAMDIFKAAFDTEDNLVKAPSQSASEEQRPANIVPIHGLRMWQGILNYFVRKSTAKAAHGKKHIVDGVHTVSQTSG